MENSVQSHLEKFADDELRLRINKIVRNERRITAALIEHLVEAHRRRLYFDWGYNSLYEYLTKELGYSGSAAYRRVQATKTISEFPDLKENLESGTLKLSQVAMVQTSIRQEEKLTNSSLPDQLKRNLFTEIENKSTLETQKIISAELPAHVPWSKQIERYRKDDTVQLVVDLEKETFAKLKRVKILYSHIDPEGPWPRILGLMAEDVIKKRDPRSKVSTHQFTDANTDLASATTASSQLSLEEASRAEIRAFVFWRDDGKCQFKNSDGSICGSEFQIEIDHITPKFAGGTDTADNLRLLCRAHNQQRYRAGTGIREVD